jgi:hypothetical protein
MTHPYKLLQGLLQKASAPSTGVVQSVAQPIAKVRTSKGIAEYATNGVAVAAGQRVLLSTGGIIGLMQAAPPDQIYDV